VDGVDLDRIFGDWVVEASVLVNASPEDVWRLVTDMERMSEFSPECVRVAWTEGNPPEVGARFVGTNRWTIDRVPPELRQGLPDDWTFEWSLPCEVVRSEPPHAFAYVVGDRFDGSPSTEWSFEIEARHGGSRLTERMRHLPNGRSFNRTEADANPERAQQIVGERDATLKADVQLTLEAMRSMLEGRV
jgi:uncharacterized protein YndB with AHSA1/START domain